MIYKNRNKRLDYNGLPISISDLAENKDNCTDESRVNATRLGQHYKFSSVYEADNDKENNSVYYEILVSEYQWVSEDFVALLEKEFTDENSRLAEADEAYGWDELYLLNRNGTIIQNGYAVKDNTVIVLKYRFDSEESFFKTAYEKRFENEALQQKSRGTEPRL